MIDRLMGPRLWLLCFVAISPSLGTAVAALGRLVLYVFALGVLLAPIRVRPQVVIAQAARPVTITVLVACAYMAAAVLWSSVDVESAWWAWSRHARLLTIPILCYLITTATEGRVVLRAFAYAQIFVVFSSWFLVFGVHAPWITGNNPDTKYAAFGTYLEQSISQAVLIGILWFQRDSIFGKSGRWFAIAMAGCTLVLTIGFLEGRSGHMVALGIMTLAILQAIPKRFRWGTIAVPFALFGVLMLMSSNFRERMLLVSSDIAAYNHTAQADTPSGVRLLFWQTSLQAIAERPLLGYGTGSWNHEYLRLEQGRALPATLTTDNPHQLFLLWAVDGGLVGLALLIAVLIALTNFSRKIPEPHALTLQATILALVISGMFNSMIYGIGMGDFFCIAIGILVSLGSKPDPSVPPSE
jgi:O-antigen ligase